MAPRRRDGTGVLFMNADKKHEKAPDMNGTLILDQDYGKGSEIKIAAWRKPTPRGYLLSLAIDNFKPNRDRQWPKEVTSDGDEIDVPF